MSEGSIAKLFAVDSGADKEEAHRAAFQKTRDPNELRWLLANRIEPGMSPGDVGLVLGEQGTRIHNDGWVKNKSSIYLTDDESWKWASDRDGNSLILVFREGRLVNFDPEEFRSVARFSDASSGPDEKR